MLELVIAMTVLNVAILALVAAMNSSALAISRASQVATATSLADAQMELYRALTYTLIRLDDTTLAADDDSTYTGEPAYDPAMEIDNGLSNATCGNPLPRECDPVRVVTGSDGRSYRIDTYILAQPSAAAGRDVKVVTVVVRDNADPNTVYVRQRSDFDMSTAR